MDKYEIILSDIKEILETIDEVNSVSHGMVTPLSEEDTFTSVYITPELDNFQAHTAGTGISSYDNTFFIRLTVHVDCTDGDLLWVTTRGKVINAILQDSAIWSNIVDRDVVSVAHDEFGNYPRKALAVLFEFRIREDCIV